MEKSLNAKSRDRNKILANNIIKYKRFAEEAVLNSNDILNYSFVWFRYFPHSRKSSYFPHSYSKQYFMTVAERFGRPHRATEPKQHQRSRASTQQWQTNWRVSLPESSLFLFYIFNSTAFYYTILLFYSPCDNRIEVLCDTLRILGDIVQQNCKGEENLKKSLYTPVQPSLVV